MPFETEYQILVKNNQYKNIRLDIDIDGTNVSNDGFVIRPYYTVFLERFLNSQNKFKFVPVSNEGVADPTSKENGLITVIAHFEKQPEPIPQPLYTASNKKCCFRGGWKGGSTVRGSSADTDWMHEQPVTYSGGVSQAGGSDMSWMKSENSVDYSCNNFITTSSICGFAEPQVNRPMGQAGATVEGSKSNQKFTEVFWAGDDPALKAVTFKFKLLGMDNNESKEWQEYMRLKEKFAAA